jgi:hypothetical protein
MSQPHTDFESITQLRDSNCWDIEKVVSLWSDTHGLVED